MKDIVPKIVVTCLTKSKHNLNSVKRTSKENISSEHFGKRKLSGGIWQISGRYSFMYAHLISRHVA